MNDLSQGPRERLVAHGAHVLSDIELLAIVLRVGVAGQPVMSLAHMLLNEFGGVRGLYAATFQQISRFPGIGTAKYAQLHASLELAKRQISESLSERAVLDHPQLVKEFCAHYLSHQKIEHCMALYLDTRHRLIQQETVSVGTLDQTAVYPREIVKQALKYNASALILAHNHPSGLPEPSAADTLFTTNVKRALELLDMRLLDHIIVAGNHTYSMAEKGLLR